MPKMKVVKIRDGDTIQGPKKTFVRLANVNAPEIGTKGAAAAQHKLEELVLDKTITYTEEGMSYGRIIGQAKVGGKSINREMKKFLKKK